MDLGRHAPNGDPRLFSPISSTHIAGNVDAASYGIEPDLALALNNLGSRLYEVGRREEEALTAIVDAVEVYRRLATAPSALAAATESCTRRPHHARNPRSHDR